MLKDLFSVFKSLTPIVLALLLFQMIILKKSPAKTAVVFWGYFLKFGGDSFSF